MKKPNVLFVLFALALGALAACDADAPATTLNDDAAAGARSSAATAYLVVRADLRRCAAPMCGGFFVSRANYATVKCADGGFKAECYVPGASFASLGLDDGEADYVTGRMRAGHAIVRGSIAPRSYSGFGNLGILNVTEAWDAWTDQAPTGTLRAVASTGIQCIAAPCPTLHATELNRNAHDTQITGLDLSALNAAEESKDAAMNLAYTDRLLTAGEIENCAGNEVVLHASQVFKKVTHKLQIAGAWRFTATDRSRFTYTFAADGTFQAEQEPGCLFSTPACAIKMALLTGIWSFDGTALHIEYTSAVRNGEVADFAVAGSATSPRLVGDDFGRTLTLKRQ